MSNFCPEWIFGVCSAATAKDFLSSENSLNSISRKFASGLSEKYTEIKFEQISDDLNKPWSLSFIDNENVIINFRY